MTADLEQQLAAAKQAVLEADHAWQLAWGHGDPRAIQAAQAAYDFAFAELGRLVRRKLAGRAG